MDERQKRSDGAPKGQQRVVVTADAALFFRRAFDLPKQRYSWPILVLASRGLAFRAGKIN